jgi:tetratricopeptide (TPR) repeat protein
LLASGTATAKGLTNATLIAMRAWVDAVRTHEPGHADAPVTRVSGLSLDTRTDLDAGMPLFVLALTSIKPMEMDLTSEPQRLIVDLARSVRGNPGAQAFLQRAAILHSDAAMFGDRYDPQVAQADHLEKPPNRMRIDPRSGIPIDTQDDARIHPLLSHKAVTLDKDGEILGDVAASWNWPFARWLVNHLDATPFIEQWYHATTAYMFANGLYGEATPHVQRAGEVMPDAPRILFDRACYSEILGLPMHQVLLPDENDAQRGLNQAEWLAHRRVTPHGTSGIPRRSVTNSEAERLFRHALRVDPSYVEARLRLARLLEVRKRHEEAAAELKTALAANPTGVVGFYAHLFAGRTAQSLGKLDDAAHHFAEASALFPNAQSALLASSQVALLGSDVSATLAPVSHLGAGSADFMADPWWRYHLAAGRDADALLRDVWSKVR